MPRKRAKGQKPIKKSTGIRADGQPDGRTVKGDRTRKLKAAQAKRKAIETEIVGGGKDPKSGQFTAGNKIGNRFKKGEVSSNPLGRPPHSRQLTAALEGWLDHPASDLKMVVELCEAHDVDPTKYTVREVIALNHLGHVLDGEGTYMKEMYNRIEGKVIEVVVGAISDKMNLSDIMAQVNNQTKTGER